MCLSVRAPRVLGLVVLAIGSIAAALALTPSAQAAQGDIAFGSCVAATMSAGQEPTGSICDDVSSTFESMSQPTGVAAAPNGHVYVSSTFSASITHLAPDPASGELTLIDCVDTDGSVLGCTQLVTATDILSDPQAIAVSGDDLYVVDFKDTVVHLSIGATGSLTFADCVTSDPAFTDCTVVSADALNQPATIAVAPDGANVYVGAVFGQAIANLSRDASGALTFSDCITAEPTNTGCTDISAETTALKPAGLAPTGAFLYATGRDDDVITQFSRGAGGTLDFDQCIRASAGLGCAAPAVPTSALDAPTGVAALPGGDVYVTSGPTDSVIHLRRDGATFGIVDCISSSAATPCQDIAATTNALDAVESIAVAPFGEDVLVGGGGFGVTSPGITNLDRSASGALSFGGCVSSSAATTGCADDISTSTNALDGTTGLAAAPDGTAVYGSGNNPDAAFMLSREPAIPTTTITSGPTGTTTDPTPTFEFVSDEAGSTFSCRVDGEGYAPCSSPRTLEPLSDGAHTFSVFATDSDGQDDPTPASRSFTVSAPQPTPAEPTPLEPAPLDKAVEGSAKAKRKQRQRGGKVLVKIRVLAEEALGARATGRLKVGSRSYPMKPNGKELASGGSKQLKLKPKKARDRKRLVRALKRGKRPKAKLTVRLIDGAGNVKVVKLRVKLTR